MSYSHEDQTPGRTPASRTKVIDPLLQRILHRHEVTNSFFSNYPLKQQLGRQRIPNLQIELPHVKQERISPIIIEPSHWIKAIPKIMLLFPNGKLTAKFFNNNIRALATHSATYRQAQDFLEKAKIPFHTFSLPVDRSLNFLLRGINNNTLVKDVQNELSELGFETTHIRQLLKNGKPLPMYMVTLPCNPTNKKLFNLTSIYYISITVKQYRASEPSQCFNC
ncbi:unnamed protein product [Macrosiphum euphorbiae]|uniref:Pre-C2HC domain-containing protein n=1 Tax=Macrosiphum euphorbiae TaxID=13131 RepID=A0AAV0W481_9HEMI|nr:unnamed protein product [Macrosiphum euphorbiae]